MVYVIQEQQGKNLVGATEYGDCKVIFPPTYQVGLSAGQATQHAKVALSNFSDDDYILLIGDPVLIGISCSVASDTNNGKVKLLKWDRQEKKYYPVSFNIHFERGERQNVTGRF